MSWTFPGSGGAVTNYVTVGPGQDYETLGLALDDGKSFIEITLDTTEDVNIDVPDRDVYVRALPGVVHTHNVNVEYVNTAYNHCFTYEGMKSEIVWSVNVLGFNGLFAMGPLSHEAVLITRGVLTLTNNTNNSALSNPFARGALRQIYLGHLTVNCGQCQTSGISMVGSNSYLNYAVIIGGGSGSSKGLQLGGTGEVGYVNFRGTFSTSAGRPFFDVNGTSIDPYLIRAIHTQIDSGGSDANLIRCKILEWNNTSAGNPDIILGTMVRILGGDLGSMNISMNRDAYFANCIVQYSQITWGAFTERNVFHNVRGGGPTQTLTVAGPSNQFLSCEGLGNIVLQSGADFCKVIGCTLGDTGVGGTTGKITLDAGCDNCVVTGNIVDEATSDSGANNSVTAEVVY